MDRQVFGTYCMQYAPPAHIRSTQWCATGTHASECHRCHQLISDREKTVTPTHCRCLMRDSMLIFGLGMAHPGN